MSDKNSLHVSGTYGPTSMTIAEQYKSLAAKYGDLVLKRDNIEEQLREVKEEILHLDAMAKFAVQAEKNGYSKAMADYKREAQGRKEPNTFEPVPTPPPAQAPKSESVKLSKPSKSESKAVKPEAEKPKRKRKRKGESK